MDSKDDITVKVLIDIRDEIRGTNKRVDDLREELIKEIRGTNSRIDETNIRVDRLTDRVVESEMRLATEITALAGSVNDTNTMLRGQRDLRDRVANCEREIAELKVERKK